ncbi:MAG: 7-carboxy-7-deazaguanine synthase QueE [Idiomarina sp.]|uniref:7-carboxy-7-deazaguanine synthase QueE n=1 Tax=Idiomarina sp. TaxID=1874361 RepID=UPI000C0F1BAD|nr:7-carboxy-7-deazaguanine synthase QueE [Idiomarina sp.]MAK71211.1 7-carboxy-7-deazaguanine synthase QueE [Idiomarinaceae bacterium]MBL4742717.1 7-carboxy-7-deazaguanine synthase QueE [Idiomarina sp.]MBT42391.1 7-carboxy-7-deazaguanine synthase QueE [Idiomarina sp.]PHQ74786.1 MAG: 7-carboxy-7-deazaguanine synthase QueE [Idiomarina sp.]HAD47772.1 7-carboxy-7-deazaguanine synthase QueE [Idiomarina sp.]
MTYRINEIFETLQGEGTFTGVPSIFIRLQGCPVGCPWCDTQHTWETRAEDEVSVATMMAKADATSQWAAMSASDILAEIRKQGYQAKHVVITGGEPAMFDLLPLANALEAQGLQLQIETSGTFELKVTEGTWVTVSPKLDMPGGYLVRADAMARANEIKHPIAMQKHIDALDALLAHNPVRDDVQICLQPISQRPRATELAMQTCIARNWRLSVQLHKYLNIE